MNKLRELIDEAKGSHMMHPSRIRLGVYASNNALALADLIDAAQECSIMGTGSVDECIAKLDKIDAALSKLEK